MSSKFIHDLFEGIRLEDFILWGFQKKYPKAIRKEGSFKYFDIHIPEIRQKIECKWDKGSEFTKNIAVEFGYRNMPSGISTTKATHWVYLFHDESWKFAIIKVKAFKELIEKARVVRGGDGLQSELYLIPKKLLYDRKDVKIETYLEELKEFGKKYKKLV